MHPYIKKIDEMCFNDEPVTKIVNWIKNTIDTDETIPQDKKQDYYITVSKLSDYKKELRNSAKDITVKLENTPILVGNATDLSDVRIEPKIDAVRKGIIEKHAEKNLINIHKTLENLAVKIEEQIDFIGKEISTSGLLDTEAHKAYRGYMNSLLMLLKELSEITGYKDFYKKMGENLGDAISKDMLDKNKKEKLKSFVYRLLVEVGDTDKIPTYIAELEKILEATSND
jgi:hypothetical protein